MLDVRTLDKCGLDKRGYNCVLRVEGWMESRCEAAEVEEGVGCESVSG